MLNAKRATESVSAISVRITGIKNTFFGAFCMIYATLKYVP